MPSPLREQLAHALFLHEHSEVAHLRFAQGDIWDAAEADERAPFLAAADAVLPLVEAEREAERDGAYDARAWTEGYEAGAAAERLRLHTQLRDQRDAIAEAYRECIWEHDGNHVTGGVMADAILAALLGVAATPQPEEHDGMPPF